MSQGQYLLCLIFAEGKQEIFSAHVGGRFPFSCGFLAPRGQGAGLRHTSCQQNYFPLLGTSQVYLGMGEECPRALAGVGGRAFPNLHVDTSFWA